jgi:hypothetical protein
MGFRRKACIPKTSDEEDAMPNTIFVGYRTPVVNVLVWASLILAVLGGGLLFAASSVASVNSTSSGWLAAAAIFATLQLAAAVGLALRRDWGRRLCIGLMSCCLLVPLAAIVGQWQHGAGGSAFMDLMATPIALVAGCVLLWSIRRLMAPEVRQEFC